MHWMKENLLLTHTPKVRHSCTNFWGAFYDQYTEDFKLAVIDHYLNGRSYCQTTCTQSKKAEMAIGVSVWQSRDRALSSITKSKTIDEQAWALGTDSSYTKQAQYLLL